MKKISEFRVIEKEENIYYSGSIYSLDDTGVFINRNDLRQSIIEDIKDMKKGIQNRVMYWGTYQFKIDYLIEKFEIKVKEI